MNTTFLTLKSLHATEIKDSRGNSTVRVSAATEHHQSEFSVPSGASTGIHEALELRDDSGSVAPAVKNVNDVIAPALRGVDVSNQQAIDQLLLELDGAPQKSHLGGNAMLAVSGALCRLASASQNLELFQYIAGIMNNQIPDPDNLSLFINMINGGKHAVDAGPFQEHQIVVQAGSMAASQQIGREVQLWLNAYLDNNDIYYTIGDEGGFVFSFNDVETPFQLIHQAVVELGHQTSTVLGADIAASSFYDDGDYHVFGDNMDAEQLTAQYQDLFSTYQLHYIEDPFFEEDFDVFARLNRELSSAVIIGDDLTTTSASRLKTAIDNQSISALIIKPNQIGTITETLETIKLAHDNDIKTIVSHRSGETMDDFIADLAVGMGAFGIKAGVWGQPEREVKYDRLLAIATTLK